RHTLGPPPTPRRPPATLFPYTTLFRSVRVRERFLAEGTITKADVERHLAALPDAAANSEEVDLEQPALAKDIDDSAASATLVDRSEEHTSELQSRENLVCRLLLEKKND